jgi:hypothetical protein
VLYDAGMAQLRLILFIVTLTILSACGSDWPPSSPQRSPVTDFSPSTSMSFNEWTYVYESGQSAAAAEAASSDRDAMAGVIGQAFVIDQGDYEIPFNLFAIDSTDYGYVDSQFEILYMDDERTQVRVTKSAGDRIGIIDQKFDPEKGMTIDFSFTHAGATVRVGDDTYELHEDGWYLAGELVHSFVAPATSAAE